MFYFLWIMVDPPMLFTSLFMLNLMWNIVDEEWSPETMNERKNTLTTYAGLHMDMMKRHPTFWKLKTCYLHSVILPGLLSGIIRDWLHYDLIILISLATYPILDFGVIPVYWITIA